MRSRVSVLQALSSCVGSTFELNLNFIVHYSSLHLPPLCSSLMLVTGLFWLVTSAGYPGLLALNCGCAVSPFVSSLTSSLRYETLIIHPGQGFLILVPLLPLHVLNALRHQWNPHPRPLRHTNAWYPIIPEEPVSHMLGHGPP